MTAEITKALIEAQAGLGGLQKLGKNKHHNYDFVSTEQMVAETRGLLRNAGLVCAPVGHRLEVFDGIAPGVLCNLRTEWLLSHSSGETLALSYDMPIVPGKGRPLDKAYSASASQALNYLLRDLLLMPRGERESIDSRDDRSHGAEPERRAPQAQAKRAPSPGEAIAAMVREHDKPPNAEIGQAMVAFIGAHGEANRLSVEDAWLWWGHEGRDAFHAQRTGR